MRYQLLIFDLGGVLVRVQPSRFVQALVDETGQPPERVRQRLDDPALFHAFERGELTASEFFERLCALCGIRWSYDAFVRAWNSVVDEDPDAFDVLERLRARYQLLVLTNTNILHDEHVRQRWPAFGRVHHWVASYQVGCRKPEPKIFQLALQQAGVPANATLYIDDLEEHIAAATQLGITGVHWTPGLRLEPELRARGVEL